MTRLFICMILLLSFAKPLSASQSVTQCLTKHLGLLNRVHETDKYYEWIVGNSVTLDPEFMRILITMMRVESTFDATALSSKGAKGILQVTDIAVREIDTAVDSFANQNKYLRFVERCQGLEVDRLFEVEHNIRAGSCYLQLMRIRYGGYIAALITYNGGTRQLLRIQKGKRLATETLNYVTQILYWKETLCEN